MRVPRLPLAPVSRCSPRKVDRRQPAKWSELLGHPSIEAIRAASTHLLGIAASSFQTILQLLQRHFWEHVGQERQRVVGFVQTSRREVVLALPTGRTQVTGVPEPSIGSSRTIIQAPDLQRATEFTRIGAVDGAVGS